MADDKPHGTKNWLIFVFIISFGFSTLFAFDDFRFWLCHATGMKVCIYIMPYRPAPLWMSHPPKAE